MAFPYAVFKTYVTGETLTASDLNSTDVNHVNHNIPEDLDDYSVNVAEMQSTADPYPASSESLATSLSGELERLRYLIDQIAGKTYWYQDPDLSLNELATLLGTSTTQITVPTGSAAGPSYSFSGDTNTGIWQNAADQISFATGGNNRINITDTYLDSGIDIRLPAGSAAGPSLTFSADTNTGMWQSGADVLDFAVGGDNRLKIRDTDIETAVPIILPTGSAAGPSLYFTGDSNTGLWQSAADQISFAIGGNNRMNLTDTYLEIGAVRLSAGSAAGPSLYFGSDTDTGLYQTTSDTISFAIGGNGRFAIKDTQIESAVAFGAPDGSAGGPGFQFDSDTDTGIYRVGADRLGISVGGNARFVIGTNSTESVKPIYIVESSTDPTEPSEGQMVIWMSDGTGKGDDGDILIASKAGGTTRYAILFDHSAGTAW